MSDATKSTPPEPAKAEPTRYGDCQFNSKVTDF